MDDFLFFVSCFIAIIVGAPWFSIVLFPVFVAMASGFVLRRFTAETIAFLKFKSRLYHHLLLHFKTTKQPQKVCACLYFHKNQLELGVQFTSKHRRWSHHVKGSSLTEIEARIHDKIERHPHQPKKMTHYPCASQSVCPNLRRKHDHRQRARELFAVRFQPQLIGLAALELGALTIIWIALSTL